MALPLDFLTFNRPEPTTFVQRLVDLFKSK